MSHGVMAVRVDDGRVVVTTTELAAATGWELKPEGLCRDEVCVPVRDPRALGGVDGVDVEAVARLLDRPLVTDPARGVAALGESASAVAASMASLQAPDVVLTDLHGTPRSIHDVGRRKRLLLAWSSW